MSENCSQKDFLKQLIISCELKKRKDVEKASDFCSDFCHCELKIKMGEKNSLIFQHPGFGSTKETR